MVSDGKLNVNQSKAATMFAGPVMVFAGAGSGKTRTLTYRVANMINEGIPAYNILAITFTNKATNEMKERLYDLVGGTIKFTTISTFHSLCARILRQDIDVIGYKRNFEIIDEEDQLKIITEALEQENIDKKRFTPKQMRKMINFNKCFNLKPSSQIEQKVFNKYEELMKEMNLLDFEDLLIKTYEVFKTSSVVLEKYRSKFQYILVDEFQDTNLIQYKIVRMLALNHRNLFVVGDDDQSIYSFRGTNYENMQLFKKDFPEYNMIILDQNYRSTQVILDGSNRLISNNKNRENKTLYSDIKGKESDVVVSSLPDERDEVDYVIAQIKDAVKRQNKEYKDFAILYRSSVISRNFELGLISNNIPYKIYGGISYLRRKEIKDVIAYLKLIIDNDDVMSFKRIVNEPSRGLGAKTIQDLLDIRRQYNLDIFTAIDTYKSKSASKFKALNEFKNLILDLKQKLNDMSLTELFEELLLQTNYVSIYEDDDNVEERKENLMEFKSILRTIENDGEIASNEEKLTAAFDEAILADDKLQNQRQSQEGVTLSTVHSVKGLEFDTVFVVAFENGIFPSFMSSSEDEDGEEERRIAYVAVTRAKNKLYLTTAKKRLLYGSISKNRPSRFLLEFSGANIFEKPKIKEYDEYGISQVEREENKKQFENSTDDKNYKIGDFIIHKVYGEGIVVSLDGTTGKICFTAQGQIKTFDMTHPSIRKK